MSDGPMRCHMINNMRTEMGRFFERTGNCAPRLDSARYRLLLSLSYRPLQGIVDIRQDDRDILIPRSFHFFLQQILKLRHPGIIVFLHRVGMVSQQHGNVIHAHPLLQKFDGKGISKHVRPGPDAFAVAVSQIERRFHQLP